MFNAISRLSMRQTIGKVKWPQVHKKHDLSKISMTTEPLPSPGQLSGDVDLSGIRTLLLSNVANGLTKRVMLHLKSRGVIVDLIEAPSESYIKKVTEGSAKIYDLIICPFLTSRVPERVWHRSNPPCLIVHPGIPGDRGMSSLDWAIDEDRNEWGVTVIQADLDMDSGTIWSTATFSIDSKTATKTGLYNGPVADAAVDVVLDSLKRYKLGIPPTPQDYTHPEVKGSLKPRMKLAQRRVDWSSSAEDIVRQIRKSDTQPGARCYLPGLEGEVVLFGGHVQRTDQTPMLYHLTGSAKPGEVIVEKNGAVLIKAGDNNSVWVTHMKRTPKKSSPKLPAAQVIRPELETEEYDGVSSWQEIITHHFYEKKVAVLHFDFYNGAMSTDQCRRLEKEIKSVAKDPRIDVVVLLGGKTFFSTGIHLNVIEASDDPAQESWENINAVNDVIKAVFSIRDKVTISALQSGGGAGGVMMAAASDLVWARQGIVLTPSYKAMALYGSEYWTYFLPSRVGRQMAEYLTESGNSILSDEAQSMGLVDDTFGRSASEFLELLPSRTEALILSPLLNYIIHKKAIHRNDYWFAMLEYHRTQELAKMKKCFVSEDYIKLRKAFVYH